MFEYFSNIFQNNQLMSRTLVALIIGSSLAYSKKIFPHIYKFIKNRFIISIELTSDSAVFEEVCKWISKNYNLNKRLRNFVVSQTWESNS